MMLPSVLRLPLLLAAVVAGVLVSTEAVAAHSGGAKALVAGLTFGGTYHGQVNLEFAFSASGDALSVTAIWGSQPFMCSNISVLELNATHLSIPELDSWNHLGSAGGLCIANGITTNAVAFAAAPIAVGGPVHPCGADPLNTCTTLTVPTYSSGPLWLLHQSFPLGRRRQHHRGSI